MVINKLLFILIFVSLNAFAKGPEAPIPPDETMDEYEISYMVRDLGSPFTTKADRFLYSGALLTLGSLWYESSTNEILAKNTGNEHPLGHFSKIGDWSGQLLPNAVYGLGMVGAYYLSDDVSVRARSLRRAFFMFETTLFAASSATVLKFAIKENRPNHNDKHAFPSGHSTTVFAFAGVVGLEHEWYYGVPAYALAAYTAFSRMNDNMHYLHDVIAGGTIGLSYAFGIWYNRHPDPKKQSEIFVLPTEDMQGVVANWQYHF